jgi:hypothetical protein
MDLRETRCLGAIIKTKVESWSNSNETHQIKIPKEGLSVINSHQKSLRRLFVLVGFFLCPFSGLIASVYFFDEQQQTEDRSGSEKAGVRLFSISICRAQTHSVLFRFDGYHCVVVVPFGVWAD